MILLIDNYDSFTYNLYQYIGKFTTDIKVVRNDKITLEEIKALNPEKIILSPGPKTPYEAGICMDVVKTFAKAVPILGICLGHQCIAAAFGGTVSYAKELFHGKQSTINHNDKGIFKGAENPLKVARYHSLSVIENQLPEVLEITAKTDDEVIMAIQHKTYPTIGLQFHPESIYTDQGYDIIENFVKGVV
ncbi:anthranilate synthase component II [Natranaerovirga hydrolytica]|uniref:anthranilate synthase component II n=1 Tax=Natranaerovirga hydrolytica TaxID=680378 RepID=UPI00104915C3|nr:aminodeoxychorismate/anthranilate synthase component II [Natranaerovirga hydrolytica]